MNKFKPWQTSEFWMTMLGATGAAFGAFGFKEAQTLVTGVPGQMLAGLILQRVLSKAVKPGQIPFTNLPPK